ncbi:SH2B adapter protein 1-like isoform X1 [Acanthaster planci]|uniref:SH2B adapter protein 1-like isoform X1 n=1 Tax=Acanthaster planci TaxID=133434 RepID=A0A8B7YSD6_ACAPL|nr:SH2B adapter protein 1-like isoform X1 [Acanthaster planci]
MNGTMEHHDNDRVTDINEFCEVEAQKAAATFAVAYHQFITENPPMDGVPVDESRFARRFADHFLDHFETEVRRAYNTVSPAELKEDRRNANDGDPTGSSPASPTDSEGNANVNTRLLSDSGPPGSRNGTTAMFNGDPVVNSRYSSNSSLDGNHSSRNINSVHHVKNEVSRLPRKFSFRNMTENVINRFRKAHHSSNQGRDRGIKYNPEDVVREGIVNFLTGEDLQGRQKWERSRLVLVKRLEGHMLDFYTPPKSNKPRNGIFCFLIEEARETTALELPEKDNTFVLKGDNSLEFVIEAQSMQDMRSWLTNIQACMQLPSLPRRPLPSVPHSPEPPATSGSFSFLRPKPNLTVQIPQPELSPDGPNSRSPLTPEHSFEGFSSQDPNPPISPPPRIPPRRRHGNSPDRLPSGGSDGPVTPELPSMQMQARPLDGSNQNINLELEETATVSDHPLNEYPWFHGTLSRVDAAKLVLQGGNTRHGVFLVRQSETRRGECVLTFNFHGRPKHLRLTLDLSGRCQVTHMWFESIFDMLDYFRSNPIPLDSRDGASQPDVTLTEFVPNAQSVSTPSTPLTPATPEAGVNRDSGGGGSGSGLGNPNSLLVSSNEFLGSGSQFSLSMNSGGQSPSPLDGQGRGSSTRAVKNQYSFV